MLTAKLTSGITRLPATDRDRLAADICRQLCELQDTAFLLAVVSRSSFDQGFSLHLTAVAAQFLRSLETEQMENTR